MAHSHLIVHLLRSVVGDTHHTDVDLDGQIVRRESHDTGRHTKRKRVSALIGTFDRRIVGEFGQHSATGKRHLVEKRKALVTPQRNELPPDGRRLITASQGIEILDADIRTGLVVAEFQIGIVQLEKRTRIDETPADGHVVTQSIGNQRTDAEIVAFRTDALDNQELIGFIGVGRIGGRTAENPLTFGDEFGADIDITPLCSASDGRATTTAEFARSDSPDANAAGESA